MSENLLLNSPKREKSSLVRMSGIVLCILVLRVILDLSYLYLLNPFFGGYQTGFDAYFLRFNADMQVDKMIESYVLTTLGAILLSGSSKKFSHIALVVFYCNAIVPIFAYFGLSNTERTWPYITMAFWAVLALVTNMSWSIKLPTSLRINHLGLFILLAAFAATTLLILALKVKLQINFDFSQIYQQRSKFGDTLTSVLSYTVSWTAQVIIPFLITLSFATKLRIRWIVTAVVVVAGLILASTAAHKSYLIKIPATFLFMYIVTRKNPIKWSVLAFIGIAVCSYGTYFWQGDLHLTNIAIRRLFFIPAQLSYYYYDFFTDTKLYLSHSIFRGFVDYPYHLPLPNMIGAYYFRRPSMNANNGVVSDGFVNFGLWGVFFWAITFALLLKISDTITKDKDPKILYPPLLLTFISLVNTTLFPSLLTHGILLSLLIAYLFPKQKSNLQNEQLLRMKVADVYTARATINS